MVSDFYFAQRDEVTRSLTAQLPALNSELEALSKDGDISIVSEEGPGLAYADMLTRGVYNARTERVRPGIPHFLPPLTMVLFCRHAFQLIVLLSPSPKRTT